MYIIIAQVVFLLLYFIIMIIIGKKDSVTGTDSIKTNMYSSRGMLLFLS